MTTRKICPFTLGKLDRSYCIEKECAVFVNDASCMKEDDDKCEREDECSKKCQHHSAGYCGMISS